MLFRFQFLGFFIVLECILLPWLHSLGSLGSLAGPVIPSGEVPFNFDGTRSLVCRTSNQAFLSLFLPLLPLDLRALTTGHRLLLLFRRDGCS
jgi:hypothetical protein